MIILMQKKQTSLNEFNDLITLGSIGSIIDAVGIEVAGPIVHWEDLGADTTFSDNENIWICGHGHKGHIQLGQTNDNERNSATLQCVVANGAKNNNQIHISKLFENIPNHELSKVSNICVRACYSAAAAFENELSITQAIEQVLMEKLGELPSPRVIGAGGISVCDPRVCDETGLQKFSVILNDGKSRQEAYAADNQAESLTMVGGSKSFLYRDLNRGMYGETIEEKTVNIYNDPRYRAYLKQFMELSSAQELLVRPNVSETSTPLPEVNIEPYDDEKRKEDILLMRAHIKETCKQYKEKRFSDSEEILNEMMEQLNGFQAANDSLYSAEELQQDTQYIDDLSKPVPRRRSVSEILNRDSLIPTSSTSTLPRAIQLTPNELAEKSRLEREESAQKVAELLSKITPIR